MTNFLLPHVILWMFTFLISVLTAVIVWPRRRLIGGGYLFIFAIFLSLWTLAGVLEATSTTLQNKVFFAQIEYIGVTPLVPLVYLFVKSYLSTRQLKTWEVIPVFIVPLITVVLAWTNSYHKLIWSSFEPGSKALNILVFNRGPFYYVHVAYIYILVALSIFILIRAYIANQKIFRQQIAAILVSFIFPLLTATLYLLGVVPVHGMDISALGFAFAGLVIAYAVFRLKFLDLLPIARQTLIDNMRDGVILVDQERRLIDINPAAQKFMHLNGSEVIGFPASNYLPHAFSGLLESTSDALVSFEMLAKDLKTYLSIYPIQLKSKNNKSTGTLIILQDITRRKIAEIKLQESNIQLQKEIQQIEILQESLRAQAVRDPLTNLFNRRYLEETLEREISRAQRMGNSVSVMMIDFDNFKEVNDQFTHLIGDQALLAFANILKKTSRREDIVCRYGGDEFLLILPDLSAEDAYTRAEAWRKTVSDLLFETPRGKMNLTVSIGLASFPQDGTTATDLITTADQAMYSAKENGKNIVRQSGVRYHFDEFKTAGLADTYSPHGD